MNSKHTCEYANNGKTITQPGKFEGEPVFAPYYWQLALEGFADSDNGREYGFRFKRGGWHRNGETHSIGGYQLDAVNQEGIVAGCHRISWKEAETFAGKMGWTTETK